MRDSVVFYKSFYESINELPPESALKIYNSIFGYAFADELPELSGIEKALFTIIKPQIDANNKRYENGRKGGRPPKKTETTKEENKNQWLLNQETSGFDNRKPNDNVNDNDNVSANDNGNANEKEDIIYTEQKKPKKKKKPEEPDDSPVIISLPLNDKTEYGVTQNYINQLVELYPAVDVMQELRYMKGWCDSKPRKCKTRDGIKRFITGWLKRAQDKGGVNRYGTYGRNAEPESSASTKLW